MAHEIEDERQRGFWSHHELPDIDENHDSQDIQDDTADYEYDMMEGDLMMDAADITAEIREKASEIGINGFEDNTLVIRVFDMLKKAYLPQTKPDGNANANANGPVPTSKLNPNKKTLARLK